MEARSASDAAPRRTRRSALKGGHNLPRFETALIVGAGAGLSASLAGLFAREGIRVALAARRPDKLTALCDAIEGHAFTCDAADSDQVARLFEALETSLGPPDVVVYNASARARGPIVDLIPAEVERALTVSAFGGFLVAQQAARRMLQKRHGAILLTVGIGERQGISGVGSVRHGQVCSSRTRPKPGTRARATGHPRGAFRDRRRYPEGRFNGAIGHPRFNARSRCHSRHLFPRTSAASQRLDLGSSAEALGGDILMRVQTPEGERNARED